MGIDLTTELTALRDRLLSAEAEHDVVAADAIPADRMGLDIGPETAEKYAAAIKDSKTVFWNGPMGVFEFPNFVDGTKAVAEAMIAATKDNGSFTVVVGPNACGKSTLLRALTGLRRPVAGTVQVDGVDLADLTPRQRATRLAHVGQEDGPPEDLTP